MKVSIEEKKAEALKRIKALRLHPNVAKEFEKDGTINFSEPPLGGLFWATDEDMERIRDFEARYDVLVYTGIRSYTNIGKMDSYLFVSDHKEEWATDNDDLKNDEVLAYVYNRDMPDCSEMGYIGIKSLITGGLVRTV